MKEIDKTLFKHSAPVRMRWSDLDELGHINNAIFLTYLEEGRISYFEQACQWDWKTDGLILANVNIDYLAPLMLQNKPVIQIRCAELGNKSFTLEYLIVDGDTTIARARTTLVMYDYKNQKAISIPERTRNKFINFEKKGTIFVR